MNDSSQQPESQIQPKSSSKLSWALILILVVVIVAGGIWYFTSANQSSKTSENTATTTPTTDNTSTTSTAAIKSDTDLQSASADLDSSNPDSIDTSLSQNDSDAAQF